MRPRQNYFNEEEFQKNLLEYNTSEIAQNKLGKQLLELIDRIQHSPSFLMYSQHIKEDMKGYAILKCIKAIQTYNPTKGRAFSYFTKTIFTAFLSELAKHYKFENYKREKMIAYLERDGYTDKEIKKIIGKYYDYNRKEKEQ